MKIVILGFSGSGKSTLAKNLSIKFKLPLLYLDKVQFLPDWKERDEKEGLAIVKEFMRGDNWVIDGNYTKFCQNKRLEQADYIIYLSFSRLNCLFRAFKRFYKYKNISRESITEGCNEKIDFEFLWWILYKGRDANKRKQYNEILNKYSDKCIVCKNQKQIDEFLNNAADYLK